MPGVRAQTSTIRRGYDVTVTMLPRDIVAVELDSYQRIILDTYS